MMRIWPYVEIVSVVVLWALGRRAWRYLQTWRTDDPAWKATGYRYRYQGYDQSKAVESARRAAELADRQRALNVKRALGDHYRRDVAEFPRKVSR